MAGKISSYRSQRTPPPLTRPDAPAYLMRPSRQQSSTVDAVLNREEPGVDRVETLLSNKVARRVVEARPLRHVLCQVVDGAGDWRVDVAGKFVRACVRACVRAHARACGDTA